MLRYVDSFSQIFGIKEYTLSGGRAKAVKAFDVRNGSGLEFTLLADKCLDISQLSFKVKNRLLIIKSRFFYHNLKAVGM